MLGSCLGVELPNITGMMDDGTQNNRVCVAALTVSGKVDLTTILGSKIKVLGCLELQGYDSG